MFKAYWKLYYVGVADKCLTGTFDQGPYYVLKMK